MDIDYNTASFTKERLQSWLNEVGLDQLPKVKQLLINADDEGSNGSHVTEVRR